MLKLRRFTKVKMFFLVLVYVFNFDLLEFSAAILEKGLLTITWMSNLKDVPMIMVLLPFIQGFGPAYRRTDVRTAGRSRANRDFFDYQIF